MADFLNLQGTTLDSFSIGLKTKKSTVSVDGTSFILDKQLDLGTHKIINVVDPEDAQDAATMNYVDTQDLLKADKVIGATNGDVAGLDASGNLTDTGILAADVVTLAGSQILTTKTIDADDNTISNIATGNFKSGVIVTTIDVDSDDTMIPTAKAVFDLTENIVILQGNWDADTNSPDITGTTVTGYAWVVSVPGDTDLGGITTWELNDWAVKSATGWLRINNQDSAAVWGNITGDIGDQGDLQDEFDLKADKAVPSAAGNVATLDGTGNLVDSGIADDTVVTLAGNQTLTTKTIDADSNTISNLETDNFASGVIVTSISGSSTDLEIPTAQAVYESIVAAAPDGAVQTVKVVIAQANVSSTFTIPNGSTIQNVTLVVTTPYAAGGTIAAAVGAVSILATADSDPQTAGQYDEMTEKVATSTAVVAVTVGGAPGSGNATLYVEFVAVPIV